MTKLKVWPNPVSQKLNISVKGQSADAYRIEIYNCNGNKVYSRSFTNDRTYIDFHEVGLVDGTYFIKYLDHNVSVVQKIVVLL